MGRKESNQTIKQLHCKSPLLEWLSARVRACVRACVCVCVYVPPTAKVSSDRLAGIEPTTIDLFFETANMVIDSLHGKVGL